MDIGYGSIRGKVRHKDEDSLLVEQNTVVTMDFRSERLLCAVADGMGGGEKGELASRIAISSVRDSCKDIFFMDQADHAAILNLIMDSVHAANRALIDYKEQNGFSSMGTTLTLSYYSEGWLHTVNAGDSRAYIFNERKTVQKTIDNSYVMGLVKKGIISEYSARNHPRRNELTVALGFEDNFFPDPYLWRCFKGDSIVLSCDGLWSAVNPTFLAEAATSRTTAQETVDSLLVYANESDGSDNISLILAKPILDTYEEDFLKKPTVTGKSLKNSV